VQLNEISGGLEGGAEPPAFQRAEKQRMEKASAQEKMKESSVVSDTFHINCCYSSIIIFHLFSIHVMLYLYPVLLLVHYGTAYLV